MHESQYVTIIQILDIDKSFRLWSEIERQKVTGFLWFSWKRSDFGYFTDKLYLSSRFFQPVLLGADGLEENLTVRLLISNCQVFFPDMMLGWRGFADLVPFIGQIKHLKIQLILVSRLLEISQKFFKLTSSRLHTIVFRKLSILRASDELIIKRQDNPLAGEIDGEFFLQYFKSDWYGFMYTKIDFLRTRFYSIFFPSYSA